MAENQTQQSRKFTFKTRAKLSENFDLEFYIEKFLATKRTEGRAPKTIKTYKQTLDRFADWYRGSDFASIDVECFRTYVNYLANDKVKWSDHPTNHSEIVGVSPRSINNIIRNTRVFFNFLKAERYISTNPTEGIKYLPESDDTFEVFTDSDVMKLLDAPNKRTYTGFRDYVMMLVLLDTGLRINELTSIKAENIDFAMRQISVPFEVAKTRKARIVPISVKTTRELERLAEMTNAELSDYIFLTQFGERYLADTFAKMLKNYGRKAGVEGVRISPHTFRHYMAIKFLQSSKDPFALMRILGHTDLAMTNRYLRYTGMNLSESHENASPVMNLLDRGNQRKRGRTRFK